MCAEIVPSDVKGWHRDTWKRNLVASRVAPRNVEEKSGDIRGSLVTHGRKSQHSIESSFVVVPFVLYSLSCCASEIVAVPFPLQWF